MPTDCSLLMLTRGRRSRKARLSLWMSVATGVMPKDCRVELVATRLNVALACVPVNHSFESFSHLHYGPRTSAFGAVTGLYGQGKPQRWNVVTVRSKSTPLRNGQDGVETVSRPSTNFPPPHCVGLLYQARPSTP